MDFKINDKVIIKDVHTCKSVFLYFNETEMSQFCGKKAKIIDINGDNIYLDISNIASYHSYFWNNKCLKKINQLVMETE